MAIFCARIDIRSYIFMRYYMDIQNVKNSVTGIYFVWKNHMNIRFGQTATDFAGSKEASTSGWFSVSFSRTYPFRDRYVGLENRFKTLKSPMIFLGFLEIFVD